MGRMMGISVILTKIIKHWVLNYKSTQRQSQQKIDLTAKNSTAYALRRGRTGYIIRGFAGRLIGYSVANNLEDNAN